MSEEKKTYVQFVIPVGEALTQVLRAIKDGEDKIRFSAFENDHHKENPQAPHYKSGNIAVWKGVYIPKEEQRP